MNAVLFSSLPRQPSPIKSKIYSSKDKRPLSASVSHSCVYYEGKGNVIKLLVLIYTSLGPIGSCFGVPLFVLCGIGGRHVGTRLRIRLF